MCLFFNIFSKPNLTSMYNLISITCCSTFDVVNISRQRSCVSSNPIFVLLFSTFVGTYCMGSCAKLTTNTCLKSIEPPLSSQVDRLMRSSLSKQSKLCWMEPPNGVARSRVQVKFKNANLITRTWTDIYPRIWR